MVNVVFFKFHGDFGKKLAKNIVSLLVLCFVIVSSFRDIPLFFCFLINIPNVLPNHTIPETKAEEDAVNIPILSCVRDPYPPATTLTVEDIIDITAKKNDILSKSEKDSDSIELK